MMPSYRRWILILFALVWGAFGVIGLFAPETILGSVGIRLESPDGFAEARGMYGGSQIGLALFFAHASRKQSRHSAGLLVAGCTMGGFALARLSGVALLGAHSSVTLTALGLELAAMTVALFALRGVEV